MPLVRIALMEGKQPSYLKSIGDAVHKAMVETISVPEFDRFQIITEHTRDTLFYDPHYLGIERSDDIVMIQIALRGGRTVEMKKALYGRIVELLRDDPGIRPEDVLITLVENDLPDWSFGNGVAQYVS
jgi:4-oxalocrotonate tautomerase